MFKDCGWEYILDYVGYSYFRKPASEMNGDEKIFCDENSKLEMLERVFKKRLLPLLIIFCTIVVPQLIVNIINNEFIMATIYIVILAVYIFVFVKSGLKYYNFKKKMK